MTSINIPSSVTSIGESAFEECSSLTSITIPELVTNIGECAFTYCNSLTSINIPGAVTTIEDGTFCGCSSLTSINIPKSVTSIGSSAFSSCSSLTFISIPESVTSIGSSAFSSCSSLTSISIPESVTSIEMYTFANCCFLPSIHIPDAVTFIGKSAFEGCYGLSSIIIPKSVNSIESGAFSGCFSLTSICIENGVSSIGESAFYGCSRVTSIILPESLTSIGSRAFEDCKSITSIKIPDAVTSIGDKAFYGCSNMNSIEIPTAVTSIGELAFYGSNKLTSVLYKAAIPIRTDKNVFNYEKNVYNTTILKMPNANLCDIKATVPWSQFKNIAAKDGVDFAESKCFESQGIIYTILDEKASTCETKALSWNEYGNPIEGNIIIPSEISDGYNNYKVVGIGEYSFMNCSNLTSVSIPETVTSIGDNAFSNCSSLKKAEFASVESLCKIEFLNEKSNPLCYANHLYINGLEITEVDIPETITSIGNYAFYGGSSLTSINIPKSVTSIGSYAFWGSNLTSIKIPESVTSIGLGTFYDCSNLTKAEFASVESLCKIEFKGWNSNPLSYAHHLFINGAEMTEVDIPESITSIGNHAFDGGSHLTSINIPKSVTSIGERAFEGCFSLTTINIPESVSAIGNSAFFYCTSLTSITIPESVDSIGSSAFSDCSNLTSINIPKRVTSVEMCTFNNCRSLTSINFPETVTYIGANAFYDCSNLTSINIPENVTYIGEGAFEYCSSLTKAEFASLESLCKIVFENSSSNPLYNAHHLYINGVEVTEIDIPESITSIGNYTFNGGSHLISVHIPESVTSIGELAFYGCCSLNSINIPNAVNSIGTGAFYDGCNLTCINSLAKIPPVIDEWTFSNYDATLNVPKGSLEAYKSAEYWKDFKKILALEITYVDKIVIKGEVNSLKKNRTTLLTAEISPEDADNNSIKWVSSNNNIATIDENGHVTSVTSGNVSFTAIACDGSGVTAIYEMTIIPPTRGDSNDNDEVTITDAVNTANFAMGNEVDNFCFEAADVNEDGHITIGDASGTIIEILNQPAQSSSKSRRIIGIKDEAGICDCLELSDIQHFPDNLAFVDVTLDNSVDYVALQADIIVPDGMIIVDVEAGPRAMENHSLMQKHVDSNTLRVVLFDVNNSAFADNQKPILRITVNTADSNDGYIGIENIHASDAIANGYRLSAENRYYSSTSGIDAVAEEFDVLIRSIAGGIAISNAEGKEIRILSMEGICIDRFIADTNNVIRNLPKGVYVVTAGNKTAKIIIR